MIIGYRAIPIVAKRLILSAISEQTGLTATIDRIRFDPLNARLSIHGFDLPDVDGATPLASFEKLVIDFRPLGFLEAGLALDEVLLVEPEIRIAIGEDGEFRLARLLMNADAEDPETADGERLVIDVRVIRVEAGRVDFRDESRDEVFELTIEPVSLEASKIVTRVGERASFSVAVGIEETTALRWTGEFEVEPLRSSGEIEISDFDLRLLGEYFSQNLLFGVRDGQLSASGQYQASLESDLSLQVTEGLIEVKEVALLDLRTPLPPSRASRSGENDPAREEVVSLPLVSLQKIRAELAGTTFVALSIDRAAVTGGHLRVVREEDGNFDLAEIFAPRTSAARDDSPSTGEQEGLDARTTRVQLDSLVIRQFGVDFEDRTPRNPVRLDFAAIALDLTGYDSASTSGLNVDLDARVGKGGHLHLGGPLVLDPLSTQLEIMAKEVALEPFLPYAESRARIELPSGRLSANIDLGIDAGHDDDSRFEARGRIQIDDLRVLEIGGAKDLLRWKALQLEEIELSSVRAQLAEIVLDEAFVDFALREDGRSNLQSILKIDPQVEATTTSREGDAASDSSFLTRVDLLRIESAVIQFSDESLEPAFRTTLSELSGTVKGLDSGSEARAEVDFRGLFDDTAPVEINGQIRPFADRGSNEIFATLSGLSMPRLAAYSGRYVGYGIDRGKLHMELEYRLEGRQLSAENRFRLDRFEFGERHEDVSPTSVPIPFALTLMKDGEGAIEIDLPIEGNLDDPSFSVLSLLGKAFVSLITKVATAPFAMIMNVAGFSVDDLSTVVFEAGSDRLSEAERLQIEGIARVLVEKSSLRIEIRGRADPVIDRLGADSARASESGRKLAQARAATVREALLAYDEIGADRVYLVEVEVGPFASGSGVASELSLSAR